MFLIHAFTILTGIIIADAVMSWFMPPDKFPRSFTIKITDPLYAPIRAILKPEKLGGVDLSPMLMIFLLQAVKNVLLNHLR